MAGISQIRNTIEKLGIVMPGLTGIWQVSGRSIVGFEDMVILDLHYIQNASLFLDLRLMVKTIPVMLFGTGAK